MDQERLLNSIFGFYKGRDGGVMFFQKDPVTFERSHSHNVVKDREKDIFLGLFS